MPLGLGQLTNLQNLLKFVFSEDTNIDRHKGKVGDLKELMLLNNLRGELEITNLGQTKDATDTNLKEKQHLRFLTLDWYSSYGNVDVMETIDYEMILEGLQPVYGTMEVLGFQVGFLHLDNLSRSLYGNVRNAKAYLHWISSLL